MKVKQLGKHHLEKLRTEVWELEILVLLLVGHSHSKMGAGTGACSSCEEREVVRDEFKILWEISFVLKNVTYNVHDFLYIKPEFIYPVEGRGTYRSGRNVGLKPYVVCRLQSVNAATGSHKANLESTKVSVRRLYRPYDISSDKALLFIYQRSLALCLMFTTFFMCIITIILCLWFHLTLCFITLGL